MFNFKKFLSFSIFSIAAVKGAAISLNSNEIKNAQCKDSFELLKKCILLIDENNEGLHPCEIYDSVECQQLYENFEDELDYCQFENDLISKIYIKDFVNSYSNVCIKDEQGKYCPLASIYADNSLDEETINEKADFDILVDIYQKNCNSELCREATINFIEVNRNNLIAENEKTENNDDDLVEVINNLENLINTLRTKQCKDSANQNIASQEPYIETSTATTKPVIVVKSSTVVKPTSVNPVTTTVVSFAPKPSPKAIVSQKPVSSLEPAKKKRKCYVKAKKN